MWLIKSFLKKTIFSGFEILPFKLMISSIGFLSKGIEVERLEKFKYDEEIAKEFQHLDIPFTKPDEEEENVIEEITGENISKDDTIIFCTPNQDEMSYIMYYGREQDKNDLFFHHDNLVLSTIIDSEVVTINNKEFIGLSSFENNIMIYNPLIKDPVLPQMLLKGHTDPVMSIKSANGILYSGGADNSIIKWDLATLSATETINTTNPVDKIILINDGVIYSSVNVIIFPDGNTLSYNSEIERLLIQDNILYFTDADGYIRSVDVRNTSQTLLEKKLHEDSIPGFDIHGDTIYTGSMDEKIKTINRQNFEESSVKEANEMVFAIKVHEDGYYVYGGEKDELKFRMLEETGLIAEK